MVCCCPGQQTSRSRPFKTAGVPHICSCAAHERICDMAMSQTLPGFCAGTYACVYADVPAGQGSESDAESRHGSQGSWNDGAEGDAAGFLCRTRRNPAEPVATRPQPGFIASSLHEPQPVLGPIHKPPDRDASPSHARALTDLHAPRPGAQPSAAGVTMSRRSLMDPEMIERRKVVSDLMEANRALREKLMELHAGSSGASMLPYIRYTLYQITVTCVATHVTGGANRRRWRPFATPEA